MPCCSLIPLPFRDTLSSPPLTLLQPARFHSTADNAAISRGDHEEEDDEAFRPVPSFASDSKWQRIYPLVSSLASTASEALQLATPHPSASSPSPSPRTPPAMISLFAAFSLPSPSPPSLASQLLVRCDPLQVKCYRPGSLVLRHIHIH